MKVQRLESALEKLEGSAVIILMSTQKQRLIKSQQQSTVFLSPLMGKERPFIYFYLPEANACWVSLGRRAKDAGPQRISVMKADTRTPLMLACAVCP